jgi:hypothetical protein
MNDFVLSPSSLNLFIEEPALWVLKQFFEIRTEANIYCVRGSLVEGVLDDWLDTGKVAPFKKYMNKMLSETMFIKGDVTKETYRGIYDWGIGCSKAFKESGYTSVLHKQTKVEGELEGLQMAGYIDYDLGHKIVDLKTTAKLPVIVSRGVREGLLSKAKGANVRQQLIYMALTQRPCSLFYVDGAGNYLEYDVTERDRDEHWETIVKNIGEIKRLLTFTKKSVIKEVEPKNLNSFYWDGVTKEFAEKVWR